MIELDISNVWTCVSLPELMGSEQQMFDAHMQLRNHEKDGPDFLGFLGLPDSINARLIHGVRRRAEQICANSDVLVVCGSGNAWEGARAAIDCYCGAGRNLLSHMPTVLFAGASLSGRQWQELTRLLEDRDYSLHIISADGQDLSVNVIARGLRWLMERKYGPNAKQRISVATQVGTPLHKMGQEEGYELFPMPTQLGGCDSALSTAALLPMAVAGIDPLSVLEGAVEGYKAMDVRAFDNPAWLYAAARYILPQKGRNRELLCVTDHAMESFGRWWNGYVRRHEGSRLSAEAALLPGDLPALDEMVCGSGNIFETVVHFAPSTKKFPVEMDWKDYDGLGFLSGQNLDFVEEQLRCAAVETHYLAGVPVLDLYAGELSAVTLGELLYFFELSSALTAMACGEDPFALRQSASTAAALRAMGAPEVVEDDEA